MATISPPSDWLRVSEAARMLQVTDQTLRRLIHRGELPASRLGSVEIRIHRDDIDTYLRARRVTGPTALRQTRGRPGSAGSEK